MIRAGVILDSNIKNTQQPFTPDPINRFGNIQVDNNSKVLPVKGGTDGLYRCDTNYHHPRILLGNTWKRKVALMISTINMEIWSGPGTFRSFKLFATARTSSRLIGLMEEEEEIKVKMTFQTHAKKYSRSGNMGLNCQDTETVPRYPAMMQYDPELQSELTQFRSPPTVFTVFTAVYNWKLNPKEFGDTRTMGSIPSTCTIAHTASNSRQQMMNFAECTS